MKTTTLFYFALVAITFAGLSCSSSNTRKESNKSNTQPQGTEDMSDFQNKETEDSWSFEEEIYETNTHEDEEKTEIVQPQEIEFEGTLTMLFHDVYGRSEIISEYRETDWDNTYLSFIINSDTAINVAPYTEYWDDELLDWLEPYQSHFMIVPEFKYSIQEFAETYANKKVRVTGTFYVPMAGWRNATTVVMSVKDIRVVEEVDVEQQNDTTNHHNIDSTSHSSMRDNMSNDTINQANQKLNEHAHKGRK